MTDKAFIYREFTKEAVMDAMNGTPKIILVTLSSGLDVLSRPIGLFARQALLKKVRDLYPDPDPAEYEKEVPGSRAGVKVPATENADYRKLADEAHKERNNWLNYQIILFCSFVQNKAAFIEACADRLNQFRQLGIDMPEDDWEASLLFVAIQNDDDFMALLNAAQDQLPLSSQEVLDGMAIFRHQLRSNGHSNPDPEQGARRTTEDQQLDTQPSDG